MSKLKASVLTAGSLALAVSGGAALAAGPTPGTAQLGVFSIDDVAFDANNVGATACPIDHTCTNLIGSGGQMLQREVTNNNTSERALQVILGDTTDGEFAHESQLRFDNPNNIDSKMRINQVDLLDADNNFFTEQTFFRGESDPNGGFPQQEIVQILGNGFQTFDMILTAIPNNGATAIPNNQSAIIEIDQNTGGAAGIFAHRILKDGGMVNDFSVDVTDGNGNTQNITVAGGSADGALTATYIGANMAGGLGTNAATRQFGVMIYRYWDDVANNSGGATQGTVPTNEIRATSLLSDNNDSGQMAGAHGHFVNGDALSMGWDETLFGTAPVVP